MIEPATSAKTVHVVGAGPAGLSTAITAAERGHKVTLFEKDTAIGGQLNMARKIPGKEEFDGLVDYYQRMLEVTGVDVRLGTVASPESLAHADEVVVATGVLPRDPGIEGQDLPHVLSYIDVLRHGAEVGIGSRSSARAGSGSTWPNF